MGNNEIFKEEIANIACNTCKSIMKVADRFCMDRDSVAGYFAGLFSELISIGTLAEWDEEENTHG